VVATVSARRPVSDGRGAATLTPRSSSVKRRPRRTPIYGPGDVGALDVLDLGRAGRALDEIGSLILQHGGLTVHCAGVTALAMVIDAWSRAANMAARDIVRAHLGRPD
jgi:hypothetical protein